MHQPALIAAQAAELAVFMPEVIAQRRQFGTVEPHLMWWTVAKIAGVEMLLAKCGLGKVNAGIATIWLITEAEASHAISIGSAGALDP